jgi:hypothetical protein
VVYDIGGSNPSTPTIEVIWTADGIIPISGAIPEELRILLLIHVFGAMVAYRSPKAMIKVRIL